MIKRHQIPYIQRTLQNITQHYAEFRHQIEQGDMEAVQKLSRLKEKAGELLNRLEDFMRNNEDDECEVYVYSMCSTIRQIIDGKCGASKINENKVSVPWKRQLSGQNKSYLSKKSKGNSVKSSAMTSKITSKVSSQYNTKQNSRMTSNRNLSSGDLFLRQDKSSRRLSTTRKSISPLNSHEKQIKKSPFTSKQQIGNSSIEQASVSKQKQPNYLNYQSLQKCLFDESQPSNIMTIKLDKSQYEQIMRLKSQLNL